MELERAELTFEPSVWRTDSRLLAGAMMQVDVVTRCVYLGERLFGWWRGLLTFDKFKGFGWRMGASATLMSTLLLCGCDVVIMDDHGLTDVADLVYCGPDDEWPDGWVDLEEAVLEAINEQRSKVTDCGEYGIYQPAEPLQWNAELQCAARSHSVDMALEDYFDHTSPSGEQPWDRMADAGYDFGAAGENIAAGYALAYQAVEAWVESDGHCANLMSPAFIDTGVGFYSYEDSSYVYYWTQLFASPASDGEARVGYESLP